MEKGNLLIRNRQRSQRVDLRLLRRVVKALLEDVAAGREHAARNTVGKFSFDLGICLVGAAEMTRLNETFLRHSGSTDVITFDYSDPARPKLLHGELFVCVDEAVVQARRFRTTWQSELARYLVHGVLHLEGFDDRRAAARRKMKREEGRWLRRLGRRFRLERLARAASPKRESDRTCEIRTSRTERRPKSEAR